MLVPSVVDVPIILPKREMNRNQWFRPIHAQSPFELDKVERGPRLVDDTSGSSRQSPRTPTTTPVNLDDNTDGDSLFNEHSEFLSSILDRSESSLDNSSISTRTTNTLTRDSTVAFSFKQPSLPTTQHPHRPTPVAPTMLQHPSTIEAALPPRRPRSAYIYFLKSVRDKNLAAVKSRRERLMNMDILLDKVDAQWKALSPQEKEIFERQASDDNHRYQRELKEYERIQSQHIIPKAPEENSFRSQSRKRDRHDSKSDVSGSTSDPNDYARKRNSPSTPSPAFRNPPHVLGEIAPPFQTMHRRPPPPPPLQPPKHPIRCKDPAMQENLPLLEGTEVEVTVSQQTRKFRVHYQCISMTKVQAEEYVRKLSHGRLSLTTLPLLDNRENTVNA